MKPCSLRAWTILLIVGLLGACAPPSPFTSTAERRSRASASTRGYAEAPQDRPGLGTKWGEQRESHVATSSFERADPAQPFARAAIYYNDPAGVRAMTDAVARSVEWPMSAASGAALVTVALRDQSGHLLPGFIADGQWFVVGEEGRRYSIVLRNRSDLRLEIVLSVDGLDVVDGRKASFRKRGYVILSTCHFGGGRFSPERGRRRRVSVQLCARILFLPVSRHRRDLGGIATG